MNYQLLIMMMMKQKIKQISFDKNQKVQIKVRTYIEYGYNYTNLTDTSKTYLINSFQNQPEKMWIECKDMYFKIDTEIDNNNVKEELKHRFFTMIITDKKIECLQVKTSQLNSVNQRRNTEL